MRVLSLQYNPERLTRSLQPQGVGDGADRSEALRLKGPPVETIKIDAEYDATDQLGQPQPDALTLTSGLLAPLSALETLLYPSTTTLENNHADAARGMFEIAPAETPLTLFVWGAQRVVPVRITDYSVTEEEFDINLNPIRAKVSLGLRVLSVTDLGFDHRGGRIYMVYQAAKELLSQSAASGTLGTLGLTGITP